MAGSAAEIAAVLATSGSDDIPRHHHRHRVRHLDPVPLRRAAARRSHVTVTAAATLRGLQDHVIVAGAGADHVIVAAAGVDHVIVAAAGADHVIGTTAGRTDTVDTRE